MCEIQDYLKSLNPNENEKYILVFGAKYKLWREGKFIGIGVWTSDDNVGDSFQRKVIAKDGKLLNEVFTPDKWELIINEES